MTNEHEQEWEGDNVVLCLGVCLVVVIVSEV
jgi:hypothetical protein